MYENGLYTPIIDDCRPCVNVFLKLMYIRRLEVKETGEVFHRMDTLMKQSGKMEKDLIEYLGLRVGTFTQWRRGKGYSYMLYTKEICDFFHVTPNYLFLGEDITMESNEDFFTSDEKEVIKCYRSAGVKEKQYIKSIVHTMAQ